MKLIVEMEMPKNLAVIVTILPDGRIFKHLGYKDKKQIGKIVGVLPEQHGDLIDRDALLKHVYKMKAPIGAEVTIVDACYITHAESVIAAEETEEQRKEPE